MTMSIVEVLDNGTMEVECPIKDLFKILKLARDGDIVMYEWDLPDDCIDPEEEIMFADYVFLQKEGKMFTFMMGIERDNEEGE